MNRRLFSIAFAMVLSLCVYGQFESNSHHIENGDMHPNEALLALNTDALGRQIFHFSSVLEDTYKRNENIRVEELNYSQIADASNFINNNIEDADASSQTLSSSYSQQGRDIFLSTISVAPDSIYAQILVEDSSNHSITITNTGNSAFNYNISLEFPSTEAISLDGIVYPSQHIIPENAEYVNGEVLVKLAKTATQNYISSLQTALGANTVKRFKATGIELWSIDKVSVADAVASFYGDPSILFIEPNYIVKAIDTPNDPLYSQLWGLHNTGQTGGTADADIDAPEAWAKGKGGSVVIGVIDTGVDYEHEDLANNMWVNIDEIPNNGIDDDNNGYIDDIHGWDFVNNDKNPMDDHYHGTHCAGTIAASGNNGIGVVGVCWNAKIMALKFLSASGSGTTDNAIEAVEYAIANHADLTSNSWGGGAYSAALETAIYAAGAQNQLFVAAAGNSSDDNDSYSHYPSSYACDNIIAVAATDYNDNLAYFSCYGARSVDIGAPGVDILSCEPRNGYQELSGTSMATPHVAGAVGLFLANNKNLPFMKVKQLLLESVDLIPALTGKCVSGGRMNLNSFMKNSISWIELDATEGSVAAGGTEVIDITLNSSGLLGGLYEANININNNDSLNSIASIPTKMLVIGRPIIGVNDSSLTFSCFVNGTDRDTLVISNGGTDVLLIDSIYTSNTMMTCSRSSMQIPARESDTLVVSFTPSVSGAVSAYLTLESNDTLQSPLNVILTGDGIIAPVLAINPDSIHVDVMAGDSAFRVLRISNSGGSNLNYSIENQNVAAESMQTDEAYTAEELVEVLEILNDSYSDITRLLPNLYEFTGGETGNRIYLGGNNMYSSYGNYLNTNLGYYVNYTNGSVSTSTYLNNNNYFTAKYPGLFVFTGNISGINTFYTSGYLGSYHSSVNSTVLEFTYAGNDYLGFVKRVYSGSAPSVNHLIIVENNGVVYQANVSSYTSDQQYIYNLAGINNLHYLLFAGESGYYYSDAVLQRVMEKYIKTISSPQWLEVGTSYGSVPAGGFVDISLDFNTNDLLGGLYTSELNIESNDPLSESVTVPISMNVEGFPIIESSHTSMSFSCFVNGTDTDTLIIANIGTDVLVIDSLFSENSNFLFSKSSLRVPAQESDTVFVTFAPTTNGLVASNLTILSNDTLQSPLNITLFGDGIIAPVMAINPDSIYVDVRAGDTALRVLRISNNGGSSLDYSIQSQFVHAETVQANEPYTSEKLEEISENLSISHASLTSLLPNMYEFTGGETGNYIYQGGNNMYSSYGNYLYTNRGNFIYTNGVVTTSSYFNGNSYFTAKYPGLFVLVGNVSDITGFNTAGTLGSYHSSVDLAELHFTYAGVNYVGFVRRVFGGTAPSVNHLIIVEDDGVVSHDHYYEYYYDEHYIYNLSGVNNLHYLLFAGASGYYYSDAVMQQVMEKYIKTIASPQWIEVDSSRGSIPAGGFADVSLNFNTDNLFGGLYKSNLNIESNDPLAKQVTVPVCMNVEGFPIIEPSRTSLTFSCYVNGTDTDTLIITNAGTDVLIIDSLFSTNSNFLFSKSSLEVPAQKSDTVIVTFAPLSNGPVATYLTILSNDTLQSPLNITLFGDGLIPPVMAVNPDSIYVDVMAGDTALRYIKISNTGGSRLDYSIQSQYVTAESIQVDEAYTAEELEVISERLNDSYSDITSLLPNLYEFTGGETGYRIYQGGDNMYSSYGNYLYTNLGRLTYTNGDVTTSSFLNGNSFFTAKYPGLFVLVGDVSDNTSFYTGGTLGSYHSTASLTELRFSFAGINYIGFVRRVYRGTAPSVNHLIIVEDNGIVGQIHYDYYYDEHYINNLSGVKNLHYLLFAGTSGYYYSDEVLQQVMEKYLRTISSPKWLNVGSSGGNISAGGFTNIPLAFETDNMLGGLYESELNIKSNDPLAQNVVVPVYMNVHGFPILETSHTNMSFSCFVNGTDTDTLIIANKGTDVLIIDSLYSNDPNFLFSHSSMEVPAQESDTVIVTFAPLTNGPVASYLTIISNDTIGSPLNITLFGNGITPPVMSFSPDSIYVDIMAGDTALRVIQISNNGGSRLDYSIESHDVKTDSVRTTDSYSTEELNDMIESLNSSYSNITGLLPNMYQFTGGETGYRISQGGNNMYSSYGNYLNTNLGYYIDYTNGAVSSSAYLNDNNYFTAKYPGLFVFVGDITGISTFYTSGSLGSYHSSVDASVLECSYGGIEYKGFVKRVYNGSAPSVNHLVIVENNNSVYQSNVSSYTSDLQYIYNLSGINNLHYLLFAGNSGYYYNDEVLQQVMEKYIRTITSPTWLNVNPAEGSIVAGRNTNISLSFNTNDLLGGLYKSDLRISSNDPLAQNVRVPILMNVNGFPIIEPSKTSMSFSCYVNGTDTDTLIIANTGTDVLIVDSAYCTNANFSLSESSFQIQPQESDTLIITFAPSDNIPIATYLILSSNDTIQSPLNITLFGEGIMPPHISINQDSIHVHVAAGDTALRVIRISNNGGSRLDFSIENNLVDTESMQSEAYTYEDMEVVLEKLERSCSNITRLLPNMYEFSGGETGYRISQGGDNMYSTYGNYLNTNTGSYINYTNGVISTSPYLNGKNYFTAKFPGLFVFVGDITGISTFYTSGSLGSYHSSVDASVLEFSYGGVNYLGFVKRVYNGSAPSVNHLIIVENNYSVYQSNVSSYTSDQQYIYNLTGISNMHYLLFAGTSGYYYNDGVMQQVMEEYIKTVTSPRWLDLNLTNGSIAAGRYADVSLSFNTEALLEGLYQSELSISSNDPTAQKLTIPVSMFVDGTPELVVSKSSASFECFVGTYEYDTIILSNAGTDSLKVSAIYTQNNDFGANKTEAIIAPFKSDTLLISFAPTTVGAQATYLVLESNDTLNTPFNIPLYGNGVLPPSLYIAPDSLSVALYADSETTEQITIGNQVVGSILEYEVGEISQTYDSTSVKSITSSGVNTRHVFSDVPFKDSLYLTILLNGDYDQSTEYANLIIEGELLFEIIDNNVSNGTDIIQRYAFGGSRVENWLADGVLEVVIDNSSEVNTGYGRSINSVQAVINGVSWLDVSNITGSITGGQQVAVEARFNSLGLSVGHYFKEITVKTNDLLNQVRTLPVHLEVIGSPVISASSDSLSFESFVGFADSMMFYIYNSGNDILYISEISVNDTSYGVVLRETVLAPHSSTVVEVLYSPVSAGENHAEIQIVSNDTARSPYIVNLNGVAIDPPSCVVTPDNLDVLLSIGDSTTKYLTIDNSAGGSDLEWSLSVFPEYESASISQMSDNLNSTEPIVKDVYPDLGQMVTGMQYDNGKLNYFSYAGEKLLVYDIDSKSVIDSFPIHPNAYGITLCYDWYWIGSNDNIIRAYNKDGLLSTYFNIPVSGNVAVSLYRGSFIVCAAGVPGADIYFVTDMGGYTLDTIFVPNSIEILEMEYVDNYLWVKSSEGVILKCTIRNRTLVEEERICFSNLDGFALAYTGDDLIVSNHDVQNGLDDAFLIDDDFTFNGWISSEIENGVVPAGSTQNVPVNFNSSGLDAGDYFATLRVESNDPTNEQIDVPVHLEVVGSPNIELATDTLVFNWCNGYSTSQFLIVRNVGTDTLRIINCELDSDKFTMLNGSALIPPGQSTQWEIVFSSEESGTFMSNLTFISNDEFSTDNVVHLIGTSIVPPIPIVNPDSICFILDTDEISTKFFTLSNVGEDNLRVFVHSQNLPSWLSVAGGYSELPTDSSMNVAISVSTEGLTKGEYTYQLGLNYGYPLNQDVTIPIHLVVSSEPHLTFETDTLKFIDLIVNESITSLVKIYNEGRGELIIEDLVINNNSFTVRSIRDSVIAPGDYTIVMITFSTPEPGAQSGTLQVLSNDTINDNILDLYAFVTDSLLFEFNPNPINVTLGLRDSLAINFNITNVGNEPVSHFLFKYTNPTWFSIGETKNLLLPNETDSVWLYFNSQDLTVGEYSSTMFFSVNANLDFGLYIPVTLNVVECVTSSTEISASICEGGYYTWNDSLYDVAGVYVQQFINQHGCDSIVTLTLDISESRSSETVVEACGSYEWNETVYQESGEYSYESTGTNGCDSIATLLLTILEPTTSETEVEVCESYSWNGQTYAESGEYTFVTTGSNNCDSIAVLVLSIQVPIISETIVEACGSYEWNGVVYEESGEYSFETTGTNGCDSTATLLLTILESTSSETEVEVCETYSWNGQTYTESGEYSFETVGVNGCDSIAHLNLTIHNGSETDTSISVCEHLVLNGEEYTESGNYTVMLTDQFGCDSILYISLEILHATEGEEHVQACGSFLWNGVNYSESGDYSATLTSSDGCDSIATIHLEILEPVVRDTFIVACDSLYFEEQTITTTGRYAFTYNATNGCDSILYVNAIVRQSVIVQLSVEACGSYSWLGVVYTESGFYQKTLQAENGCDSIVELNLTIHPILSSDTIVMACENFQWNGIDYTESGIYTFVSDGSRGCDSTAYLYLTIGHASYSDTAVVSCNVFEWNGAVYTESGVYEYSSVSQAGCDSVVVLHLTINEPLALEEVVEACGSFEWNGELYTESGEYEYISTGSNGCDSVVTLVLSILQTDSSQIEAVACESFEWEDSVYYESGIYTVVLENAEGCDSVLILNLTVNGAWVVDTAIKACGSYNFGNITYSKSGAYSDTLVTEYGCDSIVNLNLTILEPSYDEFTETACGEYSWFGETYTESGDYTVTLRNAVGCDSIITLHLTIGEPERVSTQISACEEYRWNGVSYDQSGDYTVGLISMAGCDSLVTLHLTILESSSSDTVASSCDSLMWKNEVYFESGDYTATLINAAGCDSIITLGLTVFESYNVQEEITSCYSYEWNDSVYYESGMYRIDTVSQFGCDSTYTLVLQIQNVDTSISLTGSTLIANATNAQFQWFDCSNGYSPIRNATNAEYEVDLSGGYAVEVTQGKCVDTSACFTMILVDVKIENADVSIYPNPTQNEVHISAPYIETIEVFDSKGAIIETANVYGSSHVVNLNAFTSGIYQLEIQTPQGIVIKQVILE